MTRNRFEQLLSMLHFSDNQALDTEFDRLHKITPLVEKLLEPFQLVMTADENVCIDETMVPFRGRLKFRQYFQNRRHKFEINGHKLCTQNGYTYNLKIYCGKDNQGDGNASATVVFSLMDSLLDGGRIIFSDNYYTSVNLAHQVMRRKTHLVGTVRSNSKLNCTDLVKEKLKKGENVCSGK